MYEFMLAEALLYAEHILAKTEATSQDLLDWFLTNYKTQRHEEHPCVYDPFLGKYTLYSSSIRMEHVYVKSPEELYISLDIDIDVISIWEHATKNRTFFESLVEGFCERHNLPTPKLPEDKP